MKIKATVFLVLLALCLLPRGEATTKPKLVYRDKEQPNYGEK